jgi:hypothetical protein
LRSYSCGCRFSFLHNSHPQRSARLEAEQEHDDICMNWSNQLDDWLADIDGRESSLGGALDLDGSLASNRSQYNLEAGRYNAECAS